MRRHQCERFGSLPGAGVGFGRHDFDNRDMFRSDCRTEPPCLQGPHSRRHISSQRFGRLQDPISESPPMAIALWYVLWTSWCTGESHEAVKSASQSEICARSRPASFADELSPDLPHISRIPWTDASRCATASVIRKDTASGPAQHRLLSYSKDLAPV
ncbi:hypothetical protein B0T22DRAFT_472550 [Podospora appendiculata]|uniref:Uncharacterized protein n=1 Tax=Podospora appendiculata TaxID=314037 RepID=A0AAE1C7H2_9PEZI|nr:hypothetical protein B0T22DRAFT_472550 [Podospora appendiculata]